MTDDDNSREIAELKAKLERLTAAQQTAPPKVEVTTSRKGGFRGGFFGCLGVGAAIVVVIVVLSAIGQCSRQNANAPASSAPAASSTPSAVGGTTPVADNWVYTSSSDAMSDKETKEACTTSTNQVTQGFPYHDTTARLCIRRSPKFGLDAYIRLDDDGQILCGIESCRLPIRLDKSQVQKFPAVSAADNSTNIIFINRTASFIAALKKSSSAAVDVTLYQDGVQPLTFNTKGLKWE